MKLSINIDHIATLRNARNGNEPSPITAAKICEQAGADGIVVHLREDRRHIKDEDVYALRTTISTKLDLEMAATEEIIKIALDVVPDLVTLVPEKRLELTTEGGLDILNQKKYLQTVIQQFYKKNIPVSLFVEPNIEHLAIAKEIGTDMIELHTGKYADAKTQQEKNIFLQEIKDTAAYGKKIGLIVNAGHGLDYENIHPIAAISEITEVSIGHSIISKAVFVGLENAVREMKKLVK